jgi:hypothetical protein
MSNNPVKWSARSAVVHAMSSAQLKNLAAATLVAGTEVDNSAGDQYADFELYCRGADVFHIDDYVSVWFLLKADGTNLEDGAAGVQPRRSPDLLFAVRAVNTQQRIALQHVLLPNGKFTCLLLSPANHGFTNTDNENALDYYSYNDSVVTA